MRRGNETPNRQFAVTSQFNGHLVRRAARAAQLSTGDNLRPKDVAIALKEPGVLNIVLFYHSPPNCLLFRVIEPWNLYVYFVENKLNLIIKSRLMIYFQAFGGAGSFVECNWRGVSKRWMSNFIICYLEIIKDCIKLYSSFDVSFSY